MTRTPTNTLSPPTVRANVRAFSHWRPLKFDFYILSEVVSTFLGSCIFIVFILLMLQALRLAEFFIVHGVSAILLAKMAFFLGLSFLPTALPLAFLTSVLVAFGRLSADSELIAMKASGFSMSRLSVPIFLFSIVVVGLSISLNIKWVPWGELAFKKTEIKIRNTKAVSAIREGTFTSGFFDLLIFADRVDKSKNRLYRVFIHDEREPKNPLTYVAREAEIVPIKTGSELASAIMLRLYHGSSHQNNLETHTYEKMDFDTYHLYLKISEGAESTIQKPHMIPHYELLEKIKNSTTVTYEGREYRQEYWRRYATAFSPFAFVFLGIGFGSFRNRSARASALLIGLMTLILYWTLQTAGTAAVHNGTLSAFTAMQLPNVVMLIIGLYGFYRSGW